jgi:hypothetical protein
MPVALERKLKRQAKKKGFKKGSKRYGKYVYGGLRSTGWKPKKRKKRRK